MKKAILTLLAVAVCALCLVSCKQDNTSTVYVKYSVSLYHSSDFTSYIGAMEAMEAAISSAVKIDQYGLSADSEANDKAVIAACDKVYEKPYTYAKPFTIALVKAYVGGDAKTLKLYKYGD